METDVQPPRLKYYNQPKDACSVGLLGTLYELPRYSSGPRQRSPYPWKRAVFKVLTSRPYRNGWGHECHEEDLHTVIAWDDVAEQVREEGLITGCRIYVYGTFQSESWERADGSMLYVLRIRALHVMRCVSGASMSWVRMRLRQMRKEQGYLPLWGEMPKRPIRRKR